MAHAFKTISAKPTFGTLQPNLYQSDYINRKKGIIVFQYKVDYKISRNKKITILDFIPSANNLQIVELGFREIIGNLYYRLKYL